MNAVFKCRRLFVLTLLTSLLWPVTLIAEPPQTGTFSGVIKFQGEIPQLKPLKIDKSVVLPHGVASLPDESLVINKENKGIANVFVYLRKRPEIYEEGDDKEKHEPLVLEIKDGRYVPRAMIARTGQMIKVVNRDNIAYCVHPHMFQNFVEGEVLLPDEKDELIWNFQRPERLPMQVVCDINHWMKARLLVVDHPFAAVTDKEGRFKIEGLPPANYEFSIWHEKAEFLEKKLAVPIDAGETTEAKLFYGAEKFKDD
jgi:hypothetical protein